MSSVPLHTSGTMSREEINRILAQLHEIHPPVDRDALRKYKVLSLPVRLRTTTVTVGQPQALEQQDTKLETAWMIRKKPTLVKSYPLVHTTTGTIVFSNSGHKLGGNGGFTGTQFITITHHSKMDLGSASFAKAIWYKSTDVSATHGLLCKKDVTLATNPGVDIYVSSANHIVCSIGDGTNSATLDKIVSNIRNGLWHSIIVNIPNTGNMELFVDGVSQGTQARGSVGNINNTRNTIIGGRDSAGTIVNKAIANFSWFFWKKAIFSAGQITDYHVNNIIDTSGSNVEVTTIPFIGNEDPKPNATSGLCRSTP